MSAANLPEYGYGRALRDALLDTRWAHPELFPVVDEDDETPHFPIETTDPILRLRMEQILHAETIHCSHSAKMHERIEAPGVTFYPPGVLMSTAVYCFAATPQLRLCASCWSRCLMVARQECDGRPCDRCGTGELPLDPAVVLTAHAHGIFTFLCCTYCVEHLNGGASDE